MEFHEQNRETPHRELIESCALPKIIPMKFPIILVNGRSEPAERAAFEVRTKRKAKT
jgi:hypothetical protein